MIPSSSAHRVLIADGDRAERRRVRSRIGRVADLQVIGEASNGRDAVTAALAERADIVLMDMQIPGLNASDATRRILHDARDRRVAVVAISSFAGDAYVNEALAAGVAGYLMKGRDTHLVIDAIQAAARGDAVISDKVGAVVLRELARRRAGTATPAQLASLTPDERRVIASLCSGLTASSAIADALHISVHTVRMHVNSAQSKAGVADRTQLAVWATRNGLG